MMANKLVNCPSCGGSGIAKKWESDNTLTLRTCEECGGKGSVWVPMTNADRIRAMNDDMEMAKMFVRAVADGCPPEMDWDCAKDKEGWDACDACWCKWLQHPAEDRL